ncbi:MAG: heme exporter protein CcmD [Rhodospirillaceae bacterium]
MSGFLGMDGLGMDGYGAYIWPAWGIAALVIAVLAVGSIRAMRARERELAALEAETPRRRRGGQDKDAQ